MLNRIKYKKLSRELQKRWSFDDFLFYRMQEMKADQIEALATEDELWDREKQLNDDRFRYIFNDKKEFYKRFTENPASNYMNRDIFFLEDCSEKDFFDFCKRHKKVVLKPVNMYAGLGIKIVDASDADTIASEFDRLKAEKYVAEEYVYQAAEYSTIYPKSLNTVRVTTFITDSGEPVILFAVNQFGQKDSFVDNHDEAAIWAAVDIGDGTVTAAEVEATDGRVYDIHPDTGASILGFRNPCWAEIKKLALELACMVPECRLVGWDIAVTDDYRLEVIEGNVTPELNLYQCISGRGLREVLGI